MRYEPKRSDPHLCAESSAAKVCLLYTSYLRRLLIAELKDSEEGYSDGERLIPGRTPVNCLSNATLPNC